MDIFNCLVTIIVGDKNSNWDGKIICSNEQSYLASISKIKYDLSKDGYKLPFKNNDGIYDVILNLILNGHIILLNSSHTKEKIGYLCLPNNMSENQILSLKKIQPQIEKFDLVNYIANVKNFKNNIIENEVSKIKKKKI